jgi:hypothetical protein
MAALVARLVKDCNSDLTYVLSGNASKRARGLGRARPGGCLWLALPLCVTACVHEAVKVGSGRRRRPPWQARPDARLRTCIFTDWQSMMCNDAFEREAPARIGDAPPMAMSLVEAAAAAIVALAILASIVH